MGGSIFLDSSRIAGQVRLIGAQVNRNLECNGSQFGSAIVAEDVTIKGDFKWMGIQQPENVTLDLTNASVASYGDDEKSWPSPGRLYIDGFVYRNVLAGPLDAANRLKWLSLQPKFKSQPYTQLASFLKREGDDSGAKEVLIEMERLERKGGFVANQSSDLLRRTVGYGYEPWLLLRFWVPFLLAGWLVFWRANRMKKMTPTEESAYNHAAQTGSPPPYYPRFQSLIYALENFLPLIRLGQADKWQPDPAQSCRWLRIWLWVFIILGWLFATLLVAAFTGIIHIW